MTDGLAVVARALADEAAATATALLDEASSQAAARVAAARVAAGAVMDAARRDGELAARRAGAALVADARGEARRVTLRARRDLYRSVRDQALGYLAEAGEERLGELSGALAAIARARMGEAATLTPAADGVGVVARTEDRVLVLDLAALVDAELERRAARLAEVVG